MDEDRKIRWGNGKEFRGEDRYVEKDEGNTVSNEWKSKSRITE